MRATNVVEYSDLIQPIGLVVLLSSVLGIPFAITLLIFGSLSSGRIVVGSGFIIGIVSLVGTITGWIVLGSKRVYRCARCGFTWSAPTLQI